MHSQAVHCDRIIQLTLYSSWQLLDFTLKKDSAPATDTHLAGEVVFADASCFSNPRTAKDPVADEDKSTSFQPVMIGEASVPANPAVATAQDKEVTLQIKSFAQTEFGKASITLKAAISVFARWADVVSSTLCSLHPTATG